MARRRSTRGSSRGLALSALLVVSTLEGQVLAAGSAAGAPPVAACCSPSDLMCNIRLATTPGRRVPRPPRGGAWQPLTLAHIAASIGRWTRAAFPSPL